MSLDLLYGPFARFKRNHSFEIAPLYGMNFKLVGLLSIGQNHNLVGTLDERRRRKHIEAYFSICLVRY